MYSFSKNGSFPCTLVDNVLLIEHLDFVYKNMHGVHAYHKAGKICEMVALTTYYISGFIESSKCTTISIPVTITI